MTTSQNMPKRIVALLTCAAIAVGALSACNTISGAGKDIKSAGKAIEKAGDQNK